MCYHIYIWRDAAGTFFLKPHFAPCATWGETFTFLQRWARPNPNRLGLARLGLAWPSLASSAQAGSTRLASACLGLAWHRLVWLGSAQPASDRFGPARRPAPKGGNVSPSTWFPRGGGSPVNCRAGPILRVPNSLAVWLHAARPCTPATSIHPKPRGFHVGGNKL
jgi:hypothetical protein